MKPVGEVTKPKPVERQQADVDQQHDDAESQRQAHDAGVAVGEDVERLVEQAEEPAEAAVDRRAEEPAGDGSGKTRAGRRRRRGRVSDPIAYFQSEPSTRRQGVPANQPPSGDSKQPRGNAAGPPRAQRVLASRSCPSPCGLIQATARAGAIVSALVAEKNAARPQSSGRTAGRTGRSGRE